MNLARFFLQLQRHGLGNSPSQLAILIALWQHGTPATSLKLQEMTGIPHARDIVRSLRRHVAQGWVAFSDVPNARQTFSPRRTYHLTKEGRRQLTVARMNSSC